MSKPRVVIVGDGFGGLEAAKALSREPVEITLIDRKNHHCFQPLLYQVATAALAPSDIAWPIRDILRPLKNVLVLMTEVVGIDPDARIVRTSAGRDFGYDFLIVATGATHAYFGHDDWARWAPGLKQIEDATAIRRRILLAFERAELEADSMKRAALTTFVIVGGGATGVEMAGAIAEVARHALPPDFRNIDPARSHILLIEASPRILPTMPERLSAYAERTLRQMGVEVRTGVAVTGGDERGVLLGNERIETGAVIWAAGVKASRAAEWLRIPHDRAGRAQVEQDLSVPGHPEIFIVGDAAAVFDRAGNPVPGVAPAAKQMGRHAARVVRARLRGTKAGPFIYHHQGDLATIGRKAAIVKLGHITATGFIGWLFWSVVHIYFLIGVRSRVAVAFNWLWDYVTFRRRARLILMQDP